MRFRLVATALACLATVTLDASCATSKIVGQNARLVIDGKPMDGGGLSQALAEDRQSMEETLAHFGEVLAKLRVNVQKRWGKNDAKTAQPTVYVKYTQGYKSRVVTDFDRGTLTIETVDDKDPTASLRNAIVAALLTSSDPASVNLFTDKDVTLEPDRRPYLYNLVRDNNRNPVGTRPEAEQFADYLIANKLRTRGVDGEHGANTARFVTVTMVSNFEDKAAERYRASVTRYALQYHVSSSLIMAVIRTESSFNPFSVSNAPAYGLMQLVPNTAGRDAWKRVKGENAVPTAEYLFDPDHNIELGVAYLSILDGTEFRTVKRQDARDLCVIAAYNAGAGSVGKAFGKDPKNQKERNEAINALATPALYDKLSHGMPMVETQQYVVKVSGYRRTYAGMEVASATVPPAAPGTPAPSLRH
jgi:membrane-bound lytic murein transglycosylase C